MESKGQSIFSFKKGDLIIRTAPVILTKPHYNDNLGIEIQVAYDIDNSYRKEPMEFIAIENNLIYLRYHEKTIILGGKVTKVPLEEWQDGWSLFKIPEGLRLEDCL